MQQQDRKTETTGSADAVEAMRRFNRFYTRQLGLLKEGLLDSPYPLTEVRVLFELSQRDDHTASALVHALGVDAGYLSRILKKFDQRGWLDRRASGTDARQMLLRVTATGAAELEALNKASQREVGALLDPLSPDDRQRLISSMQTIERLLGEHEAGSTAYTLRPHRIGDIGWIARRQGMLYAEEYGWDATFEALVASIGADFINQFDPEWERSWIAEMDGQIVGSVFVVRESERVAKLRMLYVEPHARDLGLGRRLTDEVIAFARARGYKSLTLWTNDILVAARRIYQSAGFELVNEEPHQSFGKELVGQNWLLHL